MTDMNLPWRINEDPAPGWEGHVYGANGMIVATACTQDMARRIKACVNRLEQFSTESIEDAGCDLFASEMSASDGFSLRVEELERELKTERCLSFRNQVAELERVQGVLVEALDLIASGVNSDARSVVISRAAIDAAAKSQGGDHE